MGDKEYIVYLHINKINRNVYVGITHYTNPEKRWQLGYKSNPHLQSAITKYGWETFNHVILFKGLSKDIACDIERTLIKKYKKNNISYNIANGGEGTQAMSEEIKEKLRQYKGPKASQFGKKHSEDRRNQQSQIMKQLWIVQREQRLNELLKYGFKAGKLHPLYGKTLDKKVRDKISASLSRPVLMIDKNTNELIREFNSTTEAEKYLNAKGHHISCCCRNKRKTAYGYKWKYKEEGRELCLIS